MVVQDYRCGIEAPVTAEEAYDRIGRVAEWWTADVTGRAREIGDRFRVRFGETFVDFEVTEAVPAARCVWKVTDSYLPWLRDKTEWTGTSLVWDITPTDGGAAVAMTHRGLVPSIECYGDCRQGWDFYAGKSLAQFLTTGKGLPDGKGASSEGETDR